MFEDVKVDASVKEDGDSLGGYLLDTDAYKMVIDMAYGEKSKGGALGVYVTFKNQEGKTLKQTFWVRGGDTKGNKTTYTTPNGDEKMLPGYAQMNTICKMALGKEIHQIATEAKTIKAYNPTLKKEAPVEKQVMVELLGKEVILGVMLQTVNKTAKNDAGKYVPTGEVRQENEVSKIFRASDSLTASEIAAGETEAVFIHEWTNKFKGTVRDRSTKVAAAGNTGTTGAPTTAGAGAAPSPDAGKSVF